MIGIFALAAFVLVFAGGSSKSLPPSSDPPCEIWLTVDTRSIAICGTEHRWRLQIDDVIQSQVYAELSTAAGAAIDRLGMKDAQRLIVSTPQARTQIAKTTTGRWHWIVELAAGGTKEDEADTILDALGEAYAAGGAL